MKNIYFIPTYYYDSIDIFKRISSSLEDDVRKIYLDTGDYFFRDEQKGPEIIKKNKLDLFFDQMHTFDFPNHSSNKIKHIYNMLKYKNAINKIFKKYKPSLIITTGDRNNFYKIISRLSNKAPIIIFQHALIHKFYYDIKN